MKANPEIINTIPASTQELNYWSTEVLPGDIQSSSVTGSNQNVVDEGWSTNDFNDYFKPSTLYKKFDKSD